MWVGDIIGQCRFQMDNVSNATPQNELHRLMEISWDGPPVPGIPKQQWAFFERLHHKSDNACFAFSVAFA